MMILSAPTKRQLTTRQRRQRERERDIHVLSSGGLSKKETNTLHSDGVYVDSSLWGFVPEKIIDSYG